jgi:hypothetical protein
MPGRVHCRAGRIGAPSARISLAGSRPRGARLRFSRRPEFTSETVKSRAVVSAAFCSPSFSPRNREEIKGGLGGKRPFPPETFMNAGEARYRLFLR